MTRPVVAIVASSQGGYGGIETFVLSLARGVSRLETVDVRVVFKLVAGYRLSDLLQTAVQGSDLRGRVVPRASARLAAAIFEADLVHAQNAPPDVVCLAWLLRKPVLLTIHNKLERRAHARNWLWRLLPHVAQQRWFNSRFVADTWGAVGRLPHTSVVHTAAQVRFDFAPFEGRKGFFFIGRWIENKGADTLIEAYAMANIDRERFPLHMAGTGPLRDQLAEYVQARGLQGIHFHGFIDEPAKHRLYGAAAWLVAPPNTKEDMGVTPMEARGRGIPCIVTRDGGLPEVAGRDALVCPPNDPRALARCLEIAAAMPDDEYRRRAHATHAELKTQVVPFDYYAGEYARQLHARGHGSAIL